MFEKGSFWDLFSSATVVAALGSLLSKGGSCGDTLPVVNSIPIQPKHFLQGHAFVKGENLSSPWQTILKVLFSDWLLVEPLILLFTMTFMNTVTKSVIPTSNLVIQCLLTLSPCERIPSSVRQEVYLGKVQMLHPDLTPDALQAKTSRFSLRCMLLGWGVP